MSGSGWETLMMSESDREALMMSGSDREALPVVREWSGGPLGCPGAFRRPSRIPGVVRWPS